MRHRFCIALATLALLASALPALAATRGFVVREEGIDIVSCWDGIVTGEFAEFVEGEYSPEFEIFFLSQDSTLIQPSAAGDSLHGSFADPVLRFVKVAPYTFKLLGLTGDSATEMTVSLHQGGSLEYGSPGLEALVLRPHQEPEGLVLRIDGARIATFRNGVTTGRILVVNGQPTAVIQVFFINDLGQEYQPTFPEFELYQLLGNPSRTSFVQTGTWAFRLTGVSVGSTDISLGIFHVDHADFSSDPITVDVVASVLSVPRAGADALALSAPAPNPARRSAQFTFTLGQASDADVSVFDLTGRQVSTLHSGLLPAGAHRVTWNRTREGAGLYFVRLRCTEGVRTQRLVVAE